MSIPASHVLDAQGLVGDAYVDLFEIQLYQGETLHLKADHSETWNSILWEGIGIQVSGEGSYSSDQVAKPTVKIQNPNAIYSQLVAQNSFTGALFTRYRVLMTDLRQNNIIYVSNVWQVARPRSLTRIAMEIELRGLSDAPNFIIPADTYQPPQYPAVTL